jgi:hypothetical protein
LTVEHMKKKNEFNLAILGKVDWSIVYS